MARLLEKPYKVGESLKELTQNLSFPGLTTGLIGATFSASVGLGIIISVAKDGKLPDALAISWIFAVFLFGGLATTVISTLYRTPVVIAWSIPGAVLIGKYLTSGGTIYQAAGTYIVIAIVVLILTATGAIKKLIDHIPVPIMLGMVGGVLLSYGIGAFANGMKVPAVYGVMVLVFFVWQFFRSLSSKIPSVVVAAIVGIIMLKVMGMTKSVPITWAIASPVFITPQFSLSSLLTLGVPLFFMVVGVQNIQAIGVLLSRDYKPPVNAIFAFPSVMTFFNAIMGGHTAVTAGPSTAIVSSDLAGPKEYRWIAAFFEGIFWVIVALLVKVGVDAAKMVPAEFMTVVAGLAMFDVFISAFEGAFSKKFRKGAMAAFFISAANISLFNVGAPFWAIIGGVLASAITEHKDFVQNKPQVEQKAA